MSPYVPNRGYVSVALSVAALKAEIERLREENERLRIQLDRADPFGTEREGDT